MIFKYGKRQVQTAYNRIVCAIVPKLNLNIINLM